MNELFKTEYKRGFDKEMELMDLLKSVSHDNVQIENSSDYDDIHNHIDFTITQTFHVDVKSLKKLGRNNPDLQEDFHFLEIKTVLGNVGWCYSEKTTHFAFETLDSWVFVEKTALQNLIKVKVKKEYVDSAQKCLYRLYTRAGRKDILTMVKTIDLMNISCQIITK